MGGAPSQSAPGYDPVAEYRAGVAALGESRFADAKRNFDRVLSVTPKDANSNYLAGSRARRIERQQGRAAIFRKGDQI